MTRDYKGEFWEKLLVIYIYISYEINSPSFHFKVLKFPSAYPYWWCEDNLHSWYNKFCICIKCASLRPWRIKWSIQPSQYITINAWLRNVSEGKLVVQNHKNRIKFEICTYFFRCSVHVNCIFDLSYLGCNANSTSYLLLASLLEHTWLAVNIDVS